MKAKIKKPLSRMITLKELRSTHPQLYEYYLRCNHKHGVTFKMFKDEFMPKKTIKKYVKEKLLEHRDLHKIKLSLESNVRSFRRVKMYSAAKGYEATLNKVNLMLKNRNLS